MLCLFLCRKAMIYIIIKSHTAFLLYLFLNELSIPAILLYIASSLLCHRQLTYSSSLIPETYIHAGTFLKSGKSLYCLTFIAVNLPTTYTFTVLPCILDKSDHIYLRVCTSLESGKKCTSADGGSVRKKLYKVK